MFQPKTVGICSSHKHLIHDCVCFMCEVVNSVKGEDISSLVVGIYLHTYSFVLVLRIHFIYCQVRRPTLFFLLLSNSYCLYCEIII